MEEKYIKNKKRVIGILLVAIMVMAVGYASFATNLVINGTANIASNWKVVFTDITQVSKTDGVEIKETPTASGTKATFNIGLTSPGDKIEYKITVANQGTIDAIIESIEASETGSDAIKFEIKNIKTGDILTKNTTTTFNVIISYDENITSQPSTLENKLTVDIKYVQSLGQDITSGNPVIQTSTTLAQAILRDNTAKSDANIDFSKSSSGHYYDETSGKVVQDTNHITKGLYYTSTNTEDNAKVYYYRGAVENNYVEFGTTPGSCIYNGTAITYGDIDTGELNIYPNQEQCTSTNVCMGSIVGVDNDVCDELGNMILSSIFEEGSLSWATCEYKGILTMYDDTIITYAPTKEQCESANVCIIKSEPFNVGMVTPGYTENDCTSEGGIWTGEKATYVGEGGYNPYQGTATYTPGETLTWRITRINEDGSVRLIYNGTSTDDTNTENAVTDNSIGQGNFNPSTIDNAYVGYMFGEGYEATYEDTHTNTNDSLIKQTIDELYNAALSSYTDMFSTTAGFCNDRSIASQAGLWDIHLEYNDGGTYTFEDTALGYGGNQTIYGAYHRLLNYKPQFKCPQTNDLFTVSSSTKGNQDLKYPIGLITADELAYAGMVKFPSIDITSDSYLKNTWTWTMTPAYFSSRGTNGANVFANLFLLLEQKVDNTLGVSPVINLKSNTNITKGNGTSSNPYVVKTN